MTTDAAGPELVEVVLLNFPLEVFQRAQEHADGLIREFALIALDRADGHGAELPVRLVAIVDALSAQFGGVSAGSEAERDAAIDRGETFMDLRYLVPPAAAEASRVLAVIFDEADEYCRAGEHLLSLATPPESLAFRTWFINEFVAQIGGAAPVPWSG